MPEHTPLTVAAIRTGYLLRPRRHLLRPCSGADHRTSEFPESNIAAASLTQTTILGALASGNQPVNLIDGDFAQLYTGLNTLATFGNYYVDAGSASALAITVPAPQVVTFVAGLPIQVKVATANTGAATIAITGGTSALGTKSIVSPNGNPLNPGAMVTGGIAWLMFDGTNVQLLNPVNGGITFSTQITTTTGTSAAFTALPVGVNRITMNMSQVQTNGTSLPIIQIGSGAFDGANYFGSSAIVSGTSTIAVASDGSGFSISGAWNAASMITGSVILSRYLNNTNTWTITGTPARTDAAAMCMCGGIHTASGMIDRIRLSTTNGTDTFVAGSITIFWE